MSERELSRHELKKLHAILREQRLEQEKTHGRVRSKSWDTKPSVKKDRKNSKQKLKNMTDFHDYNMGDD